MQPSAEIPLELAGESVVARSDASLHWVRAQTVFVADLHLGKAATFRRFGIPVPERTSDDLSRLDALIDAAAPERLVILGDFFHAKLGRTSAMLDAVHTWRARHTQLDILLIRGNHDRSAGDPPATLDIRLADAPHELAPFTLLHEPDDLPRSAPASYAFSAHLHPAIRLNDPATGASMRLPCFHITPTGATLPAFGSFTGAHIIHPGPGDRVLAIASATSLLDVTGVAATR